MAFTLFKISFAFFISSCNFLASSSDSWEFFNFSSAFSISFFSSALSFSFTIIFLSIIVLFHLESETSYFILYSQVLSIFKVFSVIWFTVNVIFQSILSVAVTQAKGEKSSQTNISFSETQ